MAELSLSFVKGPDGSSGCRLRPSNVMRRCWASGFAEPYMGRRALPERTIIDRG